MTTASLNLCKELYKISGWEHTEWSWRDYVHFTDGRTMELTDYYPPTAADTERTDYTPAYDLGYLLRKLPVGSYIATRKFGATASTGNGFQRIRPYTLFTERGDTPENACIKLCIELWKQGVFK